MFLYLCSHTLDKRDSRKEITSRIGKVFTTCLKQLWKSKHITGEQN